MFKTLKVCPGCGVNPGCFSCFQLFSLTLPLSYIGPQMYITLTRLVLRFLLNHFGKKPQYFVFLVFSVLIGWLASLFVRHLTSSPWERGRERRRERDATAFFVVQVAAGRATSAATAAQNSSFPSRLAAYLLGYISRWILNVLLCLSSRSSHALQVDSALK